MRVYQIKNFDKFIELSNSFETTLKFFEVDDKQIRAEVNRRVLIIAYKGSLSEEKIRALEDNNFINATVLESKPRFDLE